MAIEPMANGSIAVLPTNDVLQAFDGQNWSRLTGGVTKIAPLPGGRVALLAGPWLETYNGSSWTGLTGGATQLGANPNGSITVTLQDGVQCTYDGKSYTSLTPGISTILHLPVPDGSLAILHTNGQLESFNGSGRLPLASEQPSPIVNVIRQSDVAGLRLPGLRAQGRSVLRAHFHSFHSLSLPIRRLGFPFSQKAHQPCKAFLVGMTTVAPHKDFVNEPRSQ